MALFVLASCSDDSGGDASGDAADDDPTSTTAAADSSEGADGADGGDATTTTTVPLPATASSGCTDASTEATDLDGPQTFEYGGEQRRYLISTPESQEAAPVAAPLIFDLPGFGATAEVQAESTRLGTLGPERGYIVVTAEASLATVGDATGPMWNVVEAFTAGEGDEAVEEDPEADVDLSESDDVAFLDALADHIESTMCVDTAREYITGMSVGAGMTTWAICQEGTRFAAAAPVAGMTQGLFCPASEVPPFITFHGDADSQVDYDGGNLSGFDLGIPAVEERAADFAERQGCSSETTEETIGDDVVHITWDCPDGARAEVYRILGGTHVWPGPGSPAPAANQTVDASELILDFFDEQAATS